MSDKQLYHLQLVFFRLLSGTAKMFDDTGSKLEVYVYVKFVTFISWSQKNHIFCANGD